MRRKTTALLLSVMVTGLTVFSPASASAQDSFTDPSLGDALTDLATALDDQNAADTTDATGLDVSASVDAADITDSAEAVSVDPGAAALIDQSLQGVGQSIGELDAATGLAFGPQLAFVAPMAVTDPFAPTPVFTEDFENGTNNTTPTKLSDYIGATNSTTYSASGYWLNPGYCNGFITSFATNLSQDNIDKLYCGRNGGFDPGDYWAVRSKVLALGSFSNVPAGTIVTGNESATGKFNHALSTNTSGGTPSGVMFQTTKDIVLPGSSGGRFYAFSVDAAVTGCSNTGSGNSGQVNPNMYFQMVQGGKTISLPNNGNIDPCSSPDSRQFDVTAQYGYQGGSWGTQSGWIATGKVGAFYSGAFALDNSASVGLILQNSSYASSTGRGIANGSSGTYPNFPYGKTYVAPWTSSYTVGSANGNDGAIDNIRIVDVTPKMVKSFDPATESIGRESTMTISIVNRTDLGKKDGWAFTDTLPAGLQFTSNSYESTCTASSITVDPATGKLSVTGGVLNQGQKSCDIKVKVTSLESKEYTNGKPNGNFSDIKRLDGPDDAKVKFVQGTLNWTKVDPSGNPVGGAVFTVSGPDPATVKSPEAGWPVGDVEDCIQVGCSGLDKDPAPGVFKLEGLPTGTYTVTEKTPPTGFVPAKDSFTGTIALDKLDGQVNATQGGKITNTLGSVTWKKVDPSGNPLSGSEWKLTGGARDPKIDLVITDCIADSAAACSGPDKDPAAGLFKITDLPTGDYTLIETKSPAGYELLPEAAWEGELTADKADLDIGAITDIGRVVEMLPKTGGMGQWPLVAAGLLLVGIGALAARKRGA
ncbi:SpaA isopeptide-forming pilin-related protein [Corynebacterium vitaeruminis]|uniref:SpaA isopeptide-forming pilin-related protein n=1 Tax=Corynebacterium vitaeruminis TaxID=38305 RepID=UPI0018CC61AA|nr:SpaA isopeptide-forming pilin-related protein [Corynebacterium vitaeruminis]